MADDTGSVSPAAPLPEGAIWLFRIAPDSPHFRATSGALFVSHIALPAASFRSLAAKAARCDVAEARAAAIDDDREVHRQNADEFEARAKRAEALLAAVSFLRDYASTRHVIPVDELSEVFDAADAARKKMT